MIHREAYVIRYVDPLLCTEAISNTLLHHLVNSFICTSSRTKPSEKVSKTNQKYLSKQQLIVDNLLCFLFYFTCTHCNCKRVAYFPSHLQCIAFIQPTKTRSISVLLGKVSSTAVVQVAQLHAQLESTTL